MRRNTPDLTAKLGLLPSEIVTMVGRRAKARRLALNFSQAELAARSGVTLSTVRRFEQGANVGFSAVVSIAYALRVEPDLIALFAATDDSSMSAVFPSVRPSLSRWKMCESSLLPVNTRTMWINGCHVPFWMTGFVAK